MRTMIWIFCALIAACAMPGTAFAEYESSTDTGVGALDYIENQHRIERENRLEEDQKQLLKDTETLRENLPRPIDAEKPMPAVFEGDDLTYDQRTGEFVAKGNVVITQIDEHRFTSDEVTGNTQKQVIDVEGKGHMLQLTPNLPTIRLDGYQTHYNYGDHTGTMGEARGKIDHQYVTGKRFEFYPDRVVIYDGTATKCRAEKPDYQLKAEKIVIWPQKKMVMTNVGFCLGKATLYKRAHYEQDISPDAKGPDYPRVGYDTDNGVWISQDFRYPLMDKVNLRLRLYYATKDDLRNQAEVEWANAGSRFRVQYGYYEDDDDYWIKKQPNFIYNYDQHFPTVPFSYGLEYQVGQWYDNGIHSTHQYGRATLNRDPIWLAKNWILFLSANYAVTRESYNSSTVDGIGCDALTVKQFDDRWAAFLGYHYTPTNYANSLFRYGTDDYSRKFETGFSWKFSETDRFVLGLNYNMDDEHIQDVDYYWYHDIHCAQVIVRYREKREIWNVSLQFTPW